MLRAKRAENGEGRRGSPRGLQLCLFMSIHGIFLYVVGGFQQLEREEGGEAKQTAPALLRLCHLRATALWGAVWGAGLGAAFELGDALRGLRGENARLEGTLRNLSRALGQLRARLREPPGAPHSAPLNPMAPCLLPHSAPLNPMDPSGTLLHAL